MSSTPEEPQPAEASTLRRVRRAPRYRAFTLTGLLAGFIAALALVQVADPQPRLSHGTPLLYLGPSLAALGALLALLVAVLLERRS